MWRRASADSSESSAGGTAFSRTRSCAPAKRSSTSGAAKGSSASAHSSAEPARSSSATSRRTSPTCKEKARELGVLDRSRFMRAAAENLAQIESESADVVAMRSVLIYVDDKKSAFDEFFRVLRPGGRLSLFEPINRFAQTGGDTWLGYDVTAVGEAARKVRSFYEAIQPPDSDPGSHSTSATSSISYERPASSRSTCSSSRRSSRPSSAAGTLSPAC